MPSFFRSNRPRSGGGPAAARPAKRRASINLTLILGAIALVGTFSGFFYVMSSASKQYTYFVVTQEVPAGTPLSSTVIAARTGSGDPIGTNLIVGTDEMNAHLGQLVTRELLVGDVVQYSSLFWHATQTSTDPANPNAGQHYAYRFTQLIPTDKRGVVINGDPTTTYVRAGDFVDIYYSDTVSVRRMFEVQVLYAIPQVDPAAGAATGQVGIPTGTSFVLDLTPQEAQDLVWAQEHGTIRVALAAPDVDRSGTTQTTTQVYFDNTYSTNSSTGPGSSANPGSSPGSQPQPTATPAPTSNGGIPGLPSPKASS